MHTRAEQFISMFNKIEQEFRRKIKSSDFQSFYDLVNILKTKDPGVRRYSSKLKKYADLRNVISHETIDGKIVAEPNDDALNELRIISDKVLAPQRIYPEIINHKPEKLDVSDPLSKALMIFKVKKYSQIPVYQDQGYFGMFRSITIAHWLANSINDDLVSIKDMKIKDVIKFDDKEKKEIFKSLKVNAFEVLEIFQKNEGLDIKVDAIIVTENGHSDKDPLTIITEWDLPKILQYI